MAGKWPTTEHPNEVARPFDRLTRAYAEGFNAYRHGAAEGTNPHGADMAEHDAWGRGFMIAKGGNDPGHVGGPTPTAAPTQKTPAKQPTNPAPAPASKTRRRST